MSNGLDPDQDKIATNKRRVKFSTKIPQNFNPLKKLSKHGLNHICISNTPVHISLYVFVFLAGLYLRHLTLKGPRKNASENVVC